MDIKWQTNRQNFMKTYLASVKILQIVLLGLLFTALHGMQMRSSDEKAVCPSVRQMRGL